MDRLWESVAAEIVDEPLWVPTESDMFQPPQPLQMRKIVYVATVPAVVDMVNALDALPKNSQSIFVDLEGVDLTRDEPLSIISIQDSIAQRTYVLDVLALSYECFSIPGKNGRTLRDIFQDNNVVKTFFRIIDN